MCLLETPQPAPVVARKSQPWDSFLANSKVPQGQTDELLTWLSKVNQKQLMMRGQRGDRDLRKEAMLEAARLSAQAELERKQRERRNRWLQHQQLKRLLHLQRRSRPRRRRPAAAGLPRSSNA